MTGYDKFQFLRQTLFSKEKYSPFPELESLTYEELCSKGKLALEWINDPKNESNPNMEKARKKFNWILYWQNKKRPAMKPDDIMSYLT